MRSLASVRSCEWVVDLIVESLFHEIRDLVGMLTGHLAALHSIFQSTHAGLLGLAFRHDVECLHLISAVGQRTHYGEAWFHLVLYLLLHQALVGGIEIVEFTGGINLIA